MTDTKSNTKKAEPSKVWAVKKYTLGEALLEFQKLQVGAKKSELKKAFGKMSSGRKNQRPLLNKFIGMIA